MRVRPPPAPPAGRVRFLPAALGVVLLAACAPASGQRAAPLPPEAPGVRLERIADDLERPVAVAHAGDDSGRLFVVEQVGRVRWLDADGVRPEPFLDIADRVRAGGERGLLGLAFHPRYADNGRLFVHYSDLQGDTVLAEFRRHPDDPARADAGSERVLLRVAQPFGNHNGGKLAFGPDGFLYLALGDGGSGGDPQDNGQDLGTLLGKLLRIDVDSSDAENDGRAYGVPADNPFVGRDGARPEIWALGLRNPWKFSFDRATGDLFIADVGQNRYEEVNLQPAGAAGGANYGWRITEGPACFRADACDRSGLEAPILSYRHDSGWGRSITGGYRYRGAALPALQGAYLFGDYASGWLFAARPEADAWRARPLLDTGLALAAIGEDEAGEPLLADHRGGALYRLLPGE